jgi:hypothetical protein
MLDIFLVSKIVCRGGKDAPEISGESPCGEKDSDLFEAWWLVRLSGEAPFPLIFRFRSSAFDKVFPGKR